MTRRWPIAGVLIVALLAACGGGGGDLGAEDAGTTTESTVNLDGPPPTCTAFDDYSGCATTSTTSSTSTTTTTTAPETTTTTLPPPDEEFCTALVDFLDVTTAEPSTLAQINDLYDDITAAAEDLVAQAPAELEEEAVTLQRTVEDFGDELDEATSAQAALDAAEQLSEGDVADAMGTIYAYCDR